MCVESGDCIGRQTADSPTILSSLKKVRRVYRCNFPQVNVVFDTAQELLGR